MVATENITFVVAVNDREIFANNFLASACFREPHTFQILVQEKFTSAATAYNDAIGKSTNDLMAFCHQDIFLPKTWLGQLGQALEWLGVNDPTWGVLGCSGVTASGDLRGQVYSSGLGVIGQPSDRPAPVQTLDEIVLILRKSSGLRFDEGLRHFHLYGADICLRAAKRGMKSYAISAFCVHNTHHSLVLPSEFYESCRHVKQVWKDALPIQTTCIKVTRSNLPLYVRRLREAYRRYIRRQEVAGTRVSNVQQLLDGIGQRLTP